MQLFRRDSGRAARSPAHAIHGRPDGPPSHRPALILGPPDTFGPGFPFVIVTPLTTTRRGRSLHIEVESTTNTGLDPTRYIQCEPIRSINRNRLVHRLGAISPDVGNQVNTVIKTLLNY